MQPASRLDGKPAGKAAASRYDLRYGGQLTCQPAGSRRTMTRTQICLRGTQSRRVQPQRYDLKQVFVREERQ